MDRVRVDLQETRWKFWMRKFDVKNGRFYEKMTSFTQINFCFMQINFWRCEKWLKIGQKGPKMG